MESGNRAGAPADAAPISFEDVIRASVRIRPHLPPTQLRRYVPLDAAVGNGLSMMAALPDEEKRRGVVAATRGNHGLGVAWAGSLLGVAATICVPLGNNPEKNEGMRGLGAEL